MYKRVIILKVICLSILFSCTRRKTDTEQKKITGLNSEKNLRKHSDTLKTELEYLRPTTNCNYSEKLLLRFYILYKYNWQNIRRDEQKKILKTEILYDLTGYSPVLPDKKHRFKLLYSLDNDSLRLDTEAPAFQSYKYKGNYFVALFPEWVDCGRCLPPENKNRFMLYQPTVFYIDTNKIEAVKLKYNPSLKVYFRTHDSDVEFCGSEISSYNGLYRPFTFSIKKREFSFGKREGEIDYNRY